MKNTYLTSHFPLFSILVYSIAFALYLEGVLIRLFSDLGIYSGMTEFFSDNGIKITLLFVLILVFFMMLSALKIISDTIIELSLLFFSKDEEGNNLHKIRGGSWIYLISSVVALLFFKFLSVLLAIFAAATLIYFVFYLYKIRDSMSATGLIGMVLFHMLFWFTFFLMIAFAVTKLYNSFVANLPI